MVGKCIKKFFRLSARLFKKGDRGARLIFVPRIFHCDPHALQSRAHRIQIGKLHFYSPCSVGFLKIAGAGFNDRVLYFSPRFRDILISRDLNHPDFFKVPDKRSGFRQFSAILSKYVLYLIDCSVFVVRDCLNDYRNASRSRGFAHDFKKLGIRTDAGCAGNRAINVVFRHAFCSGALHGGAQARVGIRVGTSLARRNRDFFHKLAEQLSALGVSRSLFMLYLAPFTVSGHSLIENSDILRPSQNCPFRCNCAISSAPSSVLGSREMAQFRCEKEFYDGLILKNTQNNQTAVLLIPKEPINILLILQRY